jgi:hypothetical protein
VQTLSGQVEQLKAAISQTKEEAAATVKAAEDRAAGEVLKITEALVLERQAAEAARVELAKAELRLEAVPRIEREIEQVRAELNQTRERAATDMSTSTSDAAILHEKASVAEAKREAAQAAADHLIAQIADQRALFDRAIIQAEAATIAATSEAKKSAAEAAELRGKLATVVVSPTEKKPAAKNRTTPAQAKEKGIIYLTP